jgi:hypothetical protein
MDDVERRIRERAYRLWIEDGQPDGRAEDHWRRAAEQIAAEGQQPATSKAAPRAPRARRPDAKLDERDRDGVSRKKPVPTAADDAVKHDKPARAGRKASKLIDPGR